MTRLPWIAGILACMTGSAPLVAQVSHADWANLSRYGAANDSIAPPVILAGTNDIAGNSGPSSAEMIQDNLASMADIARANGIRVVLSSVLPAYDYPWRRGLDPAPKIVALNSWIRSHAEKSGAVYLDYHSAMVDARGGLRAELTRDGVHPNAAGYAVMAPLAEAAIARALCLQPR